MIQNQVISKILESKDFSIIEDNQLDSTYFRGYEKEFEFIANHFKKYQSVPDKETFLERFKDFVMVDVKESNSYLVDRIREEKMFTDLLPDLQKVNTLLEEGDTTKAVDLLQSKLKTMTINYNLGGTDIIANATTRFDDFIDRKTNRSAHYFESGFKELDEIIHGIQRGEEFMVLFARTNQGKCLCKGTQVLMADGTLKNVEDVKIGDKVQSLGRINTVEYLHNGISNGYKIIPSVGEPFIVSSQHILTLKVLKEYYDKPNHRMTTKGDFELVDVQIEDYLNWTDHKKHLAKLYRPSIEYTTKEQLIPAYILGSWLGDGTSREVAITTMDDEIRQEWANYAISNKMLFSEHIISDNKANTYSIVDKQGKEDKITTLFKNYNLLNNKHIPLNYLTGDRKQRLDLLAGLIDTDGGYSARNNTVEICFKSKELTEQVAQLCRGLGFKVGKLQIKHNKRFNKDYYKFSFTGHLAEIPNRLSRKHGKSTEKQTEVLTGFKVEPLDKVEYYGFQTDGDHRFLLWDNTLTHNTWVLEKIGVSIWQQGYNVGFISPEMSPTSVGYRFDTLLKNFSNGVLTDGQDPYKLVDEGEYKKYLTDLTNNSNKFFVATPLDFGNKITVSKLRNWVKQNALDALLIDGLTYLSDERGNNRDNKTTSLTNISEDLMSLSVELSIPVIAVVQANRNGVAGEEDKGTPELETIRDSDGISHNASKVLSLRQHNGILEIGIKKQRNGQVGGTVKYLWDIDIGNFFYAASKADEGASQETKDKAIEETKKKFEDTADVF